MARNKGAARAAGPRPVWGETGARYDMGGSSSDDQTRDRQARMREFMRLHGLGKERE